MKALLVDDERLAREELKRLLEAHPEVRVAGEAANIGEAEAAVRAIEPDLLFLDIRMPGGSGFDLLERLESVPEVIFTTAYDQYAVRAFDVNALDYLVKPVEPDRLAAAVGKVAEHLAHGRRVGGPSGKLGPGDRVFVRDGDRCWLVRLSDVTLFESEGNYTRVCFGENRPLILRALKHLEERMDPASFFRANRRQMVNLGRVAALEAAPGGGLMVVLETGGQVEVSRRRARELRELLSL